jgi:hypothetical protein
MKKNHSFYIILAVLLLSSCIKAYEPVVITPTPVPPAPKDPTPYAITDVGGVYKGGTIYLVKALLDSVTYRTQDDTSSFSLTNYYNDTIIVSINSSQNIAYKRYKLALTDTLHTTEATIFKFQKTLLDTSYYLYNKVFNLDVTLYYPNNKKVSTAVISNKSIAANNPNYIYTENVDISALYQTK